MTEGFHTEYSPRTPDTLVLTNKWQRYRMAGITLGVESRRHFYRALHLVAGVDALLGYGRGRDFTYQEYGSGTMPYRRVYSSTAREQDYGSITNASFRLYTGLRLLPRKRLILGMDLGLWAHSQLLSQPAFSVFDFSLDAPSFRILAGWRL